MTASKRTKKQPSPRHKILSLGIALFAVFLFLRVSVKSIQYTRSVRDEYSATENICTNIDGREYITAHGWVMKAYEIRENFCAGQVTKISPIGVVVNILPGVVTATAFILLSSYYMRRSVR